MATKPIKQATTTTRRGGAGKGQGRKPLKPGEDTVTVSLRMAQSQREKLQLLGGAAWVRAQLEAAVIPSPGA